MNPYQKTGRITGILLLFVFISGIIIFQVLQGPVLFSEHFLTATYENSNQIISSMILGLFSGVVSIIVATILTPIFKEYNTLLAYLYFAFCILHFVTIITDNSSIISMLEISKQYLKENHNSLTILGIIAYEKHFWTHYFYLLISCFPVFVLYYTLYLSKLVPSIISVFGIIAVVLMFIEELFSLFGNSISMNMLFPIALIQFILPLWLIFKGFDSPKLKS